MPYGYDLQRLLPSVSQNYAVASRVERLIKGGEEVKV
jgi:hypothetical protein